MEREVGYRFCPTDEELVIEFLWKKKNDPAVVVQRDIYGENRAPWQVLMEEGVDPWQVTRVWDKDTRRIKTVEKAIYVVTALSKAKDTHKRIRRDAGCGTWHGETAGHEIYDLSGRLIGHKKMFTFTVPADDPIFQGDNNINGHWIMHEYTMAGASKPTTSGSDDYALCKIIFDEAKCLKRSAPKNKKRKKGAAASTSTGDNDDDDRVQQRRKCATVTAPAPAPAEEQPQQLLLMMPQPITTGCESEKDVSAEMIPQPITTGCESEKYISADNAAVVLPPPLQCFEQESLSFSFDDELSFGRMMHLQPPNDTSSCCFGLGDDYDIEIFFEELEQMRLPDALEESTDCQPEQC